MTTYINHVLFKVEGLNTTHLFGYGVKLGQGKLVQQYLGLQGKMIDFSLASYCPLRELRKAIVTSVTEGVSDGHYIIGDITEAREFLEQTISLEGDSQKRK